MNLHEPRNKKESGSHRAKGLLKIHSLSFLTSLLIAQSAFAATSTSFVSGNTTITWTWTEDRQVGTFVNGEPWVVGPITLQSISPTDPDMGDADDVNGSMLSSQLAVNDYGVTEGSGYNQAKNISRNLPLVVNAPDMIITLENRTDHVGFESGGYLTVVSSPPVIGTFRPSIWMSESQTFNEADIVYDAFGDYAPTASVATPSNLVDAVKHPIIDIRAGGGQANTNLKITGSGGGAGYGRTIANLTHRAALSLNSNFSDADKRALMIPMIQRGIDAYGGVLAGYRMNADGGHNLGRKITMVVAAVAFDDADIKAKLNAENFRAFQEDRYYIYVTQNHIDTPHWRGEADFTQAMLGMPSWGDYDRVSRNSPDWDYTGYRHINNAGGTGFVLASEMMGMRSAINNEAMFQYIAEIAWNISSGNPGQTGWPRLPNDTNPGPQPGHANGMPAAVREMWIAHYDGLGGVPTKVSNIAVNPSGGIYADAQSVSLTTFTDGAAIYYTTDGSTPDSTDTLYTAPIAVSSTTTIKAVGIADGLANSSIANETFTISSGVASPTSSLPSGNYTAAQTVLLETNTDNASIYFTLDGSSPTTNALLYDGPILIEKSVTLKAITITPDLAMSPISEYAYTIGQFSTTDTTEWQSIPLPIRNEEFTVQWTMTPSDQEIDAVTGLSALESPGSYGDLAIIVRFSPDGYIDARDGGSYRTDQLISYIANRDYQITLNVNMANKTFDAFVSSTDLPKTQIANDYAFRTEQSEISTVNSLGMFAESEAGHLIRSIGHTPNPPSDSIVNGAVLANN